MLPIEPIHPVSGFEGSYVAVSGDPGRGSIHVVENVPALGPNSVTVVNGVRYSNQPVLASVHPQDHHVVLAPGRGVPPPLPHPGVQGQYIPNVNPIRPAGSSGHYIYIFICRKWRHLLIKPETDLKLLLYNLQQPLPRLIPINANCRQSGD